MRLIVGLVILVLLSGCATLPPVVSVPVEESAEVRTAFRSFSQQQCPSQIDADVTLVLDTLLSKGTMQGYLQALRPAYFRFEGVNPLGLTEIVLAADGTRFTLLVVREQKGYEGRLRAGKIQQYLSPAVAALFNYDWLGARTSPMIPAELLGKDPDGQGYWLGLAAGQAGGAERVLFDPAAAVIRRRQLLASGQDVAADITYQYSDRGFLQALPVEPASSACRLPAALEVKSPGNGLVTLTFQEYYPSGDLKPDQFTVPIPHDFERIVIK